MTTAVNPARVKLVGARTAFMSVFKPKAFEAGGKEKYEVTFILDPKAAYIKQIEAAMLHVAVQRWGAEKGPGILEGLVKKNKVGFQRGPRVDKNDEPLDGFEGMFNLKASNETQPTLLDADRTVLTKPGKLYSGCYVVGSVEAWAQDNDFGRRVNFTLRGVQFQKAGDAFGGGAPADVDEFEDISATEEDLVG